MCAAVAPQWHAAAQLDGPKRCLVCVSYCAVQPCQGFTAGRDQVIRLHRKKNHSMEGEGAAFVADLASAHLPNVLEATPVFIVVVFREAVLWQETYTACNLGYGCALLMLLQSCCRMAACC